VAQYLFTLTTRRGDGEPVYWNFPDTPDLFLSKQVDEVLRQASIEKQDWSDRRIDLCLTTEVIDDGEPITLSGGLSLLGTTPFGNMVSAHSQPCCRSG
jgi:hypothetical protein